MKGKKGGSKVIKSIAKMEKKMKAPVKKMGDKKEMKVDGKKSMKRLDKFARGGATGGRPAAEGMTADSPLSSAAKSKKGE